jgi:hypothetical protein
MVPILIFSNRINNIVNLNTDVIKSKVLLDPFLELLDENAFLHPKIF